MMTAIFRTFTFNKEESSAIASLTIEGDDIRIGYQGNPTMIYSYKAYLQEVPDVLNDLGQAVKNGENVSIGKVIYKLRLEGAIDEI